MCIYKLLQGDPRFFTTHIALNSFIGVLTKANLRFSFMDTVITRLASDKPVVIFSKSSCCMSHSIKTLISSFGANPTVYELDELPNGHQLEKALLASGGRRQSVPAVFIGEEFVGGANEVMSLHVKGQLVPLLKKAKAIWV